MLAEWAGWSKSESLGRLGSFFLSLAGVETCPHGNKSAWRKEPCPACGIILSHHFGQRPWEETIVQQGRRQPGRPGEVQLQQGHKMAMAGAPGGLESLSWPSLIAWAPLPLSSQLAVSLM